MGKVDLSKYIGGGKKKKKDKGNATKDVVVADIDALPEAQIDELPSGDDELRPVQVSTIKNESKGFKRIDNGNTVQPHENQNTVYRDSSGRIIDIDERRVELQQQRELQKDQQLKLEKRINQGEVQRREEERLQEQLKETRSNHLSRSDSEYNLFMKSRAHFDDPLLTFRATTSTSKEAKLNTGRPNYTKGVSPPNRFNIPAGAHWDGIDRSNGFEELIMRRRDEARAEKRNRTVDNAVDWSLELD